MHIMKSRFKSISELFGNTCESYSENYNLTSLHCSVIAACVPESATKLLHKLPKTASKILIFPIPPVFPSINYLLDECDTQLNSDWSIPMYGQRYDMDFKYWEHLMLRKQESSNIIKYKSYFRTNMPTIKISKEFQFDTLKMSLAKEWTDELQTDDIYKQDATVYVNNSQVTSDRLLKERYRRVITIAFAFAVRKQMLQAMKSCKYDLNNIANSQFEWNLKIDCEMIESAVQLIELIDEYTIVLSEIKSK